MRAILAGLFVAALSAGSAKATLIVSSDSNIITTLTDSYTTHDAGNQGFFTNVLNGSTTIVIRDSVVASSIDTSFLTGFYSSIGIGTTVIGVNTAITAADLVGTSLYIDILPQQAYTGGEIAAITAFLNSGGNFLVTGDNDLAADNIAANGYVNTLLTAIGSGIQIQGGCLACGYFDAAPTVGSGPLVANVPSVQIAAASYLTGGTALFSYNNKTVVASEEISTPAPALPEPGTWVLLIAGFGLVGTALRRRVAAAA